MNHHAPRTHPATRHARTPWAALLVLCGVASLSIAQDRANTVEEAESVLPRVDRTERVITPTRTRVAQPVRPGLTAGADWAEAAGLRPAGLPEGTFLIEREGRIIDAPAGRKVFVPTGDRVAGEGPVLILPTASLERLELAATGRGDEPAVRVSGEIFVYHGRSYLLMSSYLMGHAEIQPAAEPVADPDADPAAEAGAEPASETGDESEPEVPASLRDDPDVRGLLDELEAAAAPGRSDASGEPDAEPAAGAGRTAPPTAGVNLVPDGTPIIRRRGRIVRTGDGAWAFVFDNDLDDPVSGQAMIVMPCLLLQRMERQALVDADAFQLVVSGRIHTHAGQAYVLPTMMLQVPVTGVVPMQ